MADGGRADSGVRALCLVCFCPNDSKSKYTNNGGGGGGMTEASHDVAWQWWRGATHGGVHNYDVTV